MKSAGTFALTSLLLMAVHCDGGDSRVLANGDRPIDPSDPTNSDGYVVPPTPESDDEAARFLNEATFGARMEDIAHLRKIGYAAWFDEQFALPASSFEAWVDRAYDDPVSSDLRQRLQAQVYDSAFYSVASHAPDQLRVRMLWSLSQIFVVSGTDRAVGLRPYEFLMYYFDTLTARAFGTYRELLEAVTYNPLMGVMLTYAGSQEKPAEKIFADQNFAREIMQLFSIGLVELNRDGTPRLGGDGQPVPTYVNDDVVNLARVFTGLNFVRSDRCGGEIGCAPMAMVPDRHFWGEKRFLRTVVPAQTSDRTAAAADRELRSTLDLIAGHANVAPFISRQLIQRMVTSNPSPAYVDRVAQVFNDNGAGVRGDFKAVVKAVLLDRDARYRPKTAAPDWGKVREQALRATQVSRVLRARAADGNVWTTTGNFIYDCDTMGMVDQRPFHAPSVFNYYRPNFAPPVSRLASKGLVAPELQILDTESAVVWSRYVRDSLRRDGSGGAIGCEAKASNPFDYGDLPQLAATPRALVDRLATQWTGGVMSEPTKAAITAEVASVEGTDTAAALNRVRLGLAFTLLNPEYIVQK